MKTKISKLGRRGKIGLALLVALMFIGIASAALLPYYGKITTTANVSQSVLIDGNDYRTPISYGFDIVAGCSKWTKHKIENTACVQAPIDVDTTMSAIDLYGEWMDTDGAHVDYYILPGTMSLILENKDGDWEPIDDDYSAIFNWNPCCPTFDWSLEGTFAPDTEYVLIYYADQPDRFVNWGGAPALELATFTSDSNGDFSESDSVNLARCLPFETDWNIGSDADYTQYPDYYTHGKGAKIWLILASDYDDIDTVLTGWHPNSYLFETDLIAYFDCNINPIPGYLYPFFDYGSTAATFPYTLQPGEEICFFIKYNFDVGIEPGEYTITTKVVPVTIP